jgi:hypothetical protein
MVFHRTPQVSPDLGHQRRWRVATPEQLKWLYGVIEAIVVLNLLDAVLTIFWVHTGLADEANPLLHPLVHHHAGLFIAMKITLGAVGAWLLWQHRHRAFAVIGVFAVFTAYYAVFLQHLRLACLVALFI